MNIRVKYFTTLRELAGTGDDELNMKDGCRLLKLIETMALMYGDEAFTIYMWGRVGESIPPLNSSLTGWMPTVFPALKQS